MGVMRTALVYIHQHAEEIHGFVPTRATAKHLACSYVGSLPLDIIAEMRSRFTRYVQEMHDHLKTNLQYLKARMVKFEVLRLSYPDA